MKNRIIESVRTYFKIDKPLSETYDGWNTWEYMNRKEHPLGYFLTETFPNFMDDTKSLIINPIEELYYSLKNRFVRKYYLIDTGLNRYQYYDKDTIMLHANFKMLVDYVEIELKSLFDTDDIISELELYVENGNEGIPSWEKHYIEVYYLYKWWTEQRPIREDGLSSSGYYELLKEYDVDEDTLSYFSESWRKQNPELYSKIDSSYRTSSEIENSYDKEDQEMLHRLIDIRQSLWT